MNYVPVIVIGIYLVVIAAIGSFAFKQSKSNTEDFFLASRTIGSLVFFLSLFATNMTAFAILGSSGAAYRQGIGIYGLMASSSGFMIPLCIFFIGTRLWALGKRFGHQTQVALFRDRWECSEIGTVIFALSAAMLIPYMIISIMGGGNVLAAISTPKEGGPPLIPFEWGCAVVALVVTMNAFLGGMRGTVWVNVIQTCLFLSFGLIAVVVISLNLPGGLSENMAKMAAGPKSFLLSRERMPAEFFWSYTLVPLSAIMFPHMSIMCLSARKVTAFKRTVVVYPLAIMAVWLPCVFLGVVGAGVLVKPLQRSDEVLLHLLNAYAPAWLAGVLGAGIISAVMGSDTHQVLALSTMFTKDIFSHYGGQQKFGEKGSVVFARAFIVVATIVAYIVALHTPEDIFELAVQFAFSGFAAMAPIMVAALFWKRSTKWGALASALWVAACVTTVGYLRYNYKDEPGRVFLKSGETDIVFMTKPPAPPGKAMSKSGAGKAMGKSATGKAALPDGAEVARPVGPPPKPPAADVRVLGFMPVVPMVLGSALLMILVSLLTPGPSRETMEKYFPAKD